MVAPKPKNTMNFNISTNLFCFTSIISVVLRLNEPLIATKPSPSLAEAYLSPHGHITTVPRNQSFSLYRFRSVLIVLRYGQRKINFLWRRKIGKSPATQMIGSRKRKDR